MYFSTLLGCGWCSLVGLDWVQQTLDKVRDIRQNLLIAQSRQKALVFPRLKASFVLAPQGSLARGTTLDLHSVIIAHIGALAYRSQLLEYGRSTPMFHVFVFRKYLKDPEQKIEAKLVIIEQDMIMECCQARVLEFFVCVMHNRAIKYMKVLWTIK